MEFPGFLGNDRLKANLSAAVDRQRKPTFYLISGPEGAGKKTLARLLSAALLCRDPARRPCGQCPQCRKAMSGQHPDVITVDDPEKKNRAGEAVRQARDELFIRPNEGRRKILYIPRAQELSPAGQNALLKVLEEPPEYAVFLLLSDSPSRLLPTVRSRCVLLPLQPLPTGTIAAVLPKNFPGPGRRRFRLPPPAAADGWARPKPGWPTAAVGCRRPSSLPSVLRQKTGWACCACLPPLERQKRDTLVPLFTQWAGAAPCCPAAAKRPALPGFPMPQPGGGVQRAGDKPGNPDSGEQPCLFAGQRLHRRGVRQPGVAAVVICHIPAPSGAKGAFMNEEKQSIIAGGPMAPDENTPIDVVDVQFRAGAKVYYFDPGEFTVSAGGPCDH